MNTELNSNRAVYCCYLLHPLNPKWSKSSYIGFTNTPCRRSRQHNGETKGGAKKTAKKRPWQMLLFVYGFPTKHSALQFEFAWQHPKYSRLLKEHRQKFKGGIRGKIEVLALMLNIRPFVNYALNINWTKQQLCDQYVSLLNASKIPKFINIFVRPLHKLNYFQKHKKRKEQKQNEHKLEDILDYYAENLVYSHPASIECVCCGKREELGHLNGLKRSSLLRVYDNKFTKCPNKGCAAYLHLLCLTKSSLRAQMQKYEKERGGIGGEGISNKLRIIPNCAQCPKCKAVSEWPKFLRNTLRFVDVSIDDEEGCDSDDDCSDDEGEQVNMCNVPGVGYCEETKKQNDECESYAEGSDEDSDIEMSLAQRLKKKGINATEYFK